MANRDRAYYRRQRAKHIRRKKRICQKEYGWDYYDHDGCYSKGKIHCSCPMCSIKSKNRKSRYYAKRNWKHSDLLKINELENQEQEYEFGSEEIDFDDLDLVDVYLEGILLNSEYLNNLIDNI